MTTAQQSLKNADLATALAQLERDVRREPAVAKHRIFLFQLLSVLGQWDRALTQLNVARDMSPDAVVMAQTYQELLQCEVFRQQVFTGQRSPMLFGEPEPWVALIWEAHRLTTAGKHAEAQRLRAEAYEQAPARSGRTFAHKAAGETAAAEDDPGRPFAWIADADTRLGPLLEAVINGKYYWVPVSRIAEVRFEAATDLRDLVWIPAQFEWLNGGEVVGFVPTRYAGSELSTDDQVRMARKTEWLPQGEEVYFGLGQRVLTTDEDEFDLLSLARITFDEATPAT